MTAGANLANKTQEWGKDGHNFLVGDTKPGTDPGEAQRSDLFHKLNPGGSIASPPVTVNSPVTAPLSGTAQVSVTINNSSLAAEIKQVVQSEIKGAFSGLMGMFKSGSGNSSAGFDGRSAPSTPDGSVMHGGH